MKVCTPAISWHNRERISSVDFQPRCWPPAPAQTPKRRMASAGDDQHVVIWDVTFDSDGKARLHCLCDLSRHQNSVNIVRWSKDGKMLASGDTDSAIYLWHYQDSDAAPDIFGDDADAGDGSGDAENIASENWSVLRILRGHLNDVLCLDFSPCGQFLVSCGTDNSAIVYDVNKGNKIKILDDQKGWVNGVVWDPMEKFIVSIASDRILRVFNTKNYKCTTRTYKSVISTLPSSASENEESNKTVRLFHDDTFKSFYRRMAFSPDGEILVVPSGVLELEDDVGSSNCTYVFSRTNFTKPVLYLPNKEFSVAIRFSPVKYKLRDVARKSSGDISSDAKPWEKYETLFCLPYRMVYAVVTQNTVIFYDTQQAEPFARVSQIHYIGLNDITWSSDGNIVTVASTDGFCSVITFKDEEIGEIYDENVENENPESKTEESIVENVAIGQTTQ